MASKAAMCCKRHTELETGRLAEAWKRVTGSQGVRLGELF